MKFCLKGLKHIYTKDEWMKANNDNRNVRRDETEVMTSPLMRGIKMSMQGRGSIFAASRRGFCLETYWNVYVLGNRIWAFQGH